MKAIILAAGMGTRIQGYTKGEPKSLVKIHGVPILEHTLKTLFLLNIKDVDLVVGHKKEVVISFLEHIGLSRSVKTVFSEKYTTTGTAYSLLKGLENNDRDDVIIIEADVMFERGLLQLLAEKSSPLNAILLEKFYPGLDGSFVDLDQNGFVIDWTHKNMRPENAPIEHLFKTINIHKFSSAFVRDILLPKLQFLYPQISSHNESLERVFRDIVRENPGAIRGLDNNRQFIWQEVDDIEDLRLAQEHFKTLAIC